MEEVTEDKPVEVNEPVDDNFFDDVDQEVIKKGFEDTDENEQNDTQEPLEQQESDEDNEVSSEESPNQDESSENDYSDLLKDLSSKIKYNGENVNVESEDELITNYQKGLNYDKLMEKYNSLANSKPMTYITRKAKELGYSVDEYMDQVEAYEKQQQREQEQARLEEMVNNGVPEDVAKEVIATSQLRRELQAEKSKIEEEKQKRQAEEEKNHQYEDFLNAYPNVKAEDIPKEVFENAQSSNLRQAYTEWRIKQLEQEVQIAKQNSENQKKSVGSTTEHGGATEKVQSDPFLEGFDYSN